jgi:preprotein translocase subunit Sec63
MPGRATGHNLRVDPFEVLGLDREASRDDVREAYRRLAKP